MSYHVQVVYQPPEGTAITVQLQLGAATPLPHGRGMLQLAQVRPMTPMPFGALLRAIREQRGWGYIVCARQVGCDPSYLAHLEAGRRHPSRAFCTAFCTGLKLSPAEATALYLAAGYLPPAEQEAPGSC
jgi:hypothetical protein